MAAVKNFCSEKHLMTFINYENQKNNITCLICKCHSALSFHKCINCYYILCCDCLHSIVNRPLIGLVTINADPELNKSYIPKYNITFLQNSLQSFNHFKVMTALKEKDNNPNSSNINNTSKSVMEIKEKLGNFIKFDKNYVSFLAHNGNNNSEAIKEEIGTLKDFCLICPRHYGDEFNKCSKKYKIFKCYECNKSFQYSTFNYKFYCDCGSFPLYALKFKCDNPNHKVYSYFTSQSFFTEAFASENIESLTTEFDEETTKKEEEEKIKIELGKESKPEYNPMKILNLSQILNKKNLITRLIDEPESLLKNSIKLEQSNAHSISISSDLKYIAAGFSDKTARIYKLSLFNNQKKEANINTPHYGQVAVYMHKYEIKQVYFYKTKNLDCLIATSKNLIYIWDISKLEIENEKQIETKSNKKNSTSTNEKINHNKVANEVDNHSNHPFIILSNHSKEINQLSFTDNKKRLASGGKDNYFIIWSMDYDQMYLYSLTFI